MDGVTLFWYLVAAFIYLVLQVVVIAYGTRSDRLVSQNEEIKTLLASILETLKNKDHDDRTV